MTEQEMTEQWLEGCAVQRIMFRDGLVLNFDDYNELVISVPLQLTLPAIETSPAEVVAIDPNDPADHERPLFDFAGATCTAFVWYDTGDLHLPMIASPHGNCMANTTDTPRAWRQASCELCGMT